MTERNIKIAFIVNLFLLLCLIATITFTAFSWFTGQGYNGKTMAYNKGLYIGAADSLVTNFYAVDDGAGGFQYIEITSSSSFTENNLEPGSYVYLKTEVKNNSQTHDSVSSLYLQNIEYSAPLSPYLFFGKNEPVASRGSYSEIAVFNQQEEKYKIHSLPLLTNFTVEPDSTLEVFWYVYIDTSAGLEIANTFINLGNVTLTHNS